MPANGEIIEANALPTTLTIIKPVLSSSPVYPIPIHEKGLPKNDVWSVNGTGDISSGTFHRSTYIAFLANGTYGINVSGPSNYFYAHSMGITVNGRNSSINIVFTSKALVYETIGKFLIGIFLLGGISFLFAELIIWRRKG